MVSQEPRGLVARMEDHQVAIYLGAMAPRLSTF
jgi:hypothetical protein